MSEEKMEHSPLPWALWPNPEVNFMKDLSAGNGSFVLSCRAKDAQFIVTACNSYYENKAAIAELVEAVEALMEYGIEKCDTWYRLDEIRALIAKQKAGE